MNEALARMLRGDTSSADDHALAADHQRHRDAQAASEAARAAERRQQQANAEQAAQQAWAANRDRLRNKANRAGDLLRDAQRRLDVALEEDDMANARVAAIDMIVWTRGADTSREALAIHESQQPGRRR